LLTAVRQLGWTQARVRIAGPTSEPGYAETLRQTARGLNVEFLGSLRADQMPAFLRGLDVLALTSIWPENLPFVMLEAQAAGVPVAAGDMPGIADQIANPNLLFQPGSAEALAATLAWAREHPVEARPGRVGTIEQMTEATEAVYRAALERRNGSAQ
jgi:glycosyltransferase involved in cell wall biosynthesis